MTHSNKRLNCIETSHQQYILNQTATKCNQHFNVNVLKKNLFKGRGREIGISSTGSFTFHSQARPGQSQELSPGLPH